MKRITPERLEQIKKFVARQAKSTILQELIDEIEALQREKQAAYMKGYSDSDSFDMAWTNLQKQKTAN